MLRPRQVRPPPRPRAPAGSGSSCLAQRVADTANGVDQPRLAAGLRLAPQVADIDVERVRAVAEVVAPDSLEDHRSRQHLPWVQHEELEQRELRSRQLDRLAAALDLARARIELEIGELQGLARAVGRAAQERAQAR